MNEPTQKPMTAAALISLLQTMPPDLEVVAYDECGSPLALDDDKPLALDDDRPCISVQELFDYACYLRHSSGSVDIAREIWRVGVGYRLDFSESEWEAVHDICHLSPEEVRATHGLEIRVGGADYVTSRGVVFSCQQCERVDQRKARLT